MEASRILIIDDVPANREILQGYITALGYQASMAANGKIAWEGLLETEPDLILCDILMPEMDGYVFLAKLKETTEFRDIPIIMISALDEMESITRCLEMGADDYLVKPFNPQILKARITACLNKKMLRDNEKFYTEKIEEYNRTLENRVQQGIKKFSAAQLGMIFALSKLAESRDPETGAHLERMREYCQLLAGNLRKSPLFSKVIDDTFIENIRVASPLHDIGKVGIPDYVLLKPGKLTAAEFDVMKTHTTIGMKTLSEVNREFPGNTFVEMGIMIADCHHEKFDGTGYPNGYKGEQIPLAARIIALGDVYDALTSKRCYKEAFPHELSRTIIMESRGTHFDPNVVDAFLETEAQFVDLRKRLRD